MATIFAVGFSLDRSYGIIAITNVPTTYSESFNSLPLINTPWENNVILPGWYAEVVLNGAPQNPITLNADDGSSATSGLYNYGVAADADRALGSLGFSGVAEVEVFYGAGFINNTSETITDVEISYTGEQWRDANFQFETLSFFYRVGETNFFTTPDNVGWISETNLNFDSPQNSITGALNGNDAANRISLTNQISGLSVPPGETFWIRWYDANSPGVANQGLSVDDLSVTFSSTSMVANLTGIKVELKKPKEDKTLKFKSTKGFGVKGNVITTNTVTQVSYIAFGGTNTPTNLTFIEPVKFNELKKGKLFKKKGVKYQFNSRKNRAGVGITEEPVTLIFRLEGSQGTNAGVYYQTNVFNDVEIK